MFLAITLNSSKISDDLDKSYGKPYYFAFWSLNKCIRLVSDSPFSRGTLVDITETSDDSVLMVRPISKQEKESLEGKKPSFLMLLATDIPLTEDVDYDFSVGLGEVNILKTVKATNKGFSSYLLATLVESKVSKVIGKDKKYKDEVEFIIDLSKHFDKYSGLN